MTESVFNSQVSWFLQQNVAIIFIRIQGRQRQKLQLGHIQQKICRFVLVEFPQGQRERLQLKCLFFAFRALLSLPRKCRCLKVFVRCSTYDSFEVLRVQVRDNIFHTPLWITRPLFKDRVFLFGKDQLEPSNNLLSIKNRFHSLFYPRFSLSKV